MLIRHAACAAVAGIVDLTMSLAGCAAKVNQEDFNNEEAKLRESDRPVRDRFASVVKEYYPGALVTVEGFADPAGSRAYNLRLGQQRAEAVRDYLASNGGLPPAGLKAVSYGEASNRQVVRGAQGPGDTGMENRRVTLVIDHAAVAFDRGAMP